MRDSTRRNPLGEHDDPCESVGKPLEAPMDAARQKLEVDRNYDAFTRMLGSLLPDHRDELALMRDGRIVGFFETPRQALHAATDQFPDGIFSIQEVTDEPIDLGFWSHVSH
jgi:hypothetical protein